MDQKKGTTSLRTFALCGKGRFRSRSRGLPHKNGVSGVLGLFLMDTKIGLPGVMYIPLADLCRYRTGPVTMPTLTKKSAFPRFESYCHGHCLRCFFDLILLSRIFPYIKCTSSAFTTLLYPCKTRVNISHGTCQKL